MIGAKFIFGKFEVSKKNSVSVHTKEAPKPDIMAFHQVSLTEKSVGKLQIDFRTCQKFSILKIEQNRSRSILPHYLTE